MESSLKVKLNCFIIPYLGSNTEVFKVCVRVVFCTSFRITDLFKYKDMPNRLWSNLVYRVYSANCMKFYIVMTPRHLQKRGQKVNSEHQASD